MATPTNFDPNNYAAFYQEALKRGEDNARSIAAQTSEMAKGSAMEQTRDQGFALGQASKFGDTQNYRDKIMNDIGQKAELDRTKMLGEQEQKVQANNANQQNLLTGIAQALLQMKLAKEAASKSGGGSGGYAGPKIDDAALKKILGNAEKSNAGVAPTALTKKEESRFWKAMDYIPGAMLTAAPFVGGTVVGLPIAGVLTALGVAGGVANAAHEMNQGSPATGAGTAGLTAAAGVTSSVLAPGIKSKLGSLGNILSKLRLK